MRPIRFIRRTLSRASITKVLPLAAFSLGIVLAIVFTSFYFFQAKTTYDRTTDENAAQLTQILAEDMASGSLEISEKTVSTMLAGRAIVRDTGGTVLFGELAPSLAHRAKDYPIATASETLGTLTYVPRTPYQPPIPYALAAAICLLVAILATLLVFFLTRLISQYIDRVTDIVNDYSLNTSSTPHVGDWTFAELNKLSLATMRTSRRISNEVEALRLSSLTDERTGLKNERGLRADIETALQADKSGRHTALILFEFCSGLQIGARSDLSLPPEAYQPIAERLKAFVHQIAERHGLSTTDCALASLFSDQFALLVRNVSQRDTVASLVRYLIADFRVPVHYDRTTLAVELKGSIVMLPDDGHTASLALDRAAATLDDLRLRKKSGFSFYSPKLERQRDAKIKLESELRDAVRNEMFVPLFQPKVDLETGEIMGCEALARWQLDNGRFVSPSVFIDLAEETGLINQIGDQIMRKACAQAAKWTAMGHPMSLAVNVSPRQFENEGLGEQILDALATSGLSPRQLEIEITESLAIQHPERVRSVLRPLRRLGIKLAVDDFGTGHSNLAVLTQFDFDVFKIDRQFVMGTPDDEQANAIVEMILSMAHTLKMSIVGEGIETAAQANFLTARGCNIGQGYHYSPPVSADAFLKLLKNQPFMQRQKTA